MMMFWIICALMLLVALLFVVLPILLGSQNSKAVLSKNANLEIYRDQVAEMDADVRNGLLTQDMYEQGRQELQSRLLDDASDAIIGKKLDSLGFLGARSMLLFAFSPIKAIRMYRRGQRNFISQLQNEAEAEHNANSASGGSQLKALAMVLAIVLPLVTVGIYYKVGNPDALLPHANASDGNQFGTPHSAALLKELEEKVAATPDDPAGLYHLARLYTESGRFAEAAKTYDKLTRIVPNEAQLWADYAEVMAMAAGSSMKGIPAILLEKSLTLDPNNYKALAFSGSAAMESGDYKLTVQHWEKLLKLLPKDNENVGVIENGIANARALMAQKSGEKVPEQSQRSAAGAEQQAQSGSEAITGTVVLDATLKGKVSPDDTLFVLVRAAEGSRMPLAIVRKQVKDLPLTFKLDDSTAMTPQMKLSKFEQVVVVARVSKSGNAMTQPGDLQGVSAIVKPGSKGIKLNIDTVAP